MLHANNLPFPPDETFAGHSGMTLADVSIDHLVGRTYVVPDTQHATGYDVILRLVKNTTGSDITVANQIFRFGTDSKDFGRYVDGTTNLAGMIGLPIYDGYTAGSTILANDYFYVVQQGPCDIDGDASSMNLVAHEPVTPNASGALKGLAAGTGEFLLGTVDVDSGTAGATALVYVDATLVNAYGSGT